MHIKAVIWWGLSLWVLQGCAQTAVLSPSPALCALTQNYTSTSSSVGVLTLSIVKFFCSLLLMSLSFLIDIISSVSNGLDELIFLPSVGDDTVLITTTAISDSTVWDQLDYNIFLLFFFFLFRVQLLHFRRAMQCHLQLFHTQ